MGLRYDEISEIIKLIDSSSCDEFVLETEEIKLVVRRRNSGSAIPAQTDERAANFSSSPAATATPEPLRTAGAIPEAAGDGMYVVRAPMVGTFYRSPSPDAPPFIEVGTKVNKGDPLCIIEVMKLFTTIDAEWSGIVIEIGADNGQLVEFGQMLVVLAPEQKDAF
jgi:acetyl-CoA carboxylase biotin carboxyl carrier protein